MTSQVIPEAAVEAMMDAANDAGFVLKRSLARDWLEAAAPHIRAQALDEAATELDGKRLLPKAFHIFYPEWLRTRAAGMTNT